MALQLTKNVGGPDGNAYSVDEIFRAAEKVALYVGILVHDCEEHWGISPELLDALHLISKVPPHIWSDVAVCV